LAKENGGNQNVFFEFPMTQAVKRYFQIERDLHLALTNAELRLYLQSQVNSLGEIAGVEALVR
jgi:sensor c-di-GMP phosphodiesterase-like protein